MPKFVPAKKRCVWGKVQDTYVPAVTFCVLTFETAFDFDLGYYQNGLWFQESKQTLPFLVQSWKGKYVSPPLNGAAQAIKFGR